MNGLNGNDSKTSGDAKAATTNTAAQSLRPIPIPKEYLGEGTDEKELMELVKEYADSLDSAGKMLALRNKLENLCKKQLTAFGTENFIKKHRGLWHLFQNSFSQESRLAILEWDVTQDNDRYYHEYQGGETQSYDIGMILWLFSRNEITAAISLIVNFYKEYKLHRFDILKTIFRHFAESNLVNTPEYKVLAKLLLAKIITPDIFDQPSFGELLTLLQLRSSLIAPLFTREILAIAMDKDFYDPQSATKAEKTDAKTEEPETTLEQLILDTSAIMGSDDEKAEPHTAEDKADESPNIKLSLLEKAIHGALKRREAKALAALLQDPQRENKKTPSIFRNYRSNTIFSLHTQRQLTGPNTQIQKRIIFDEIIRQVEKILEELHNNSDKLLYLQWLTTKIPALLSSKKLMGTLDKLQRKCNKDNKNVFGLTLIGYFRQGKDAMLAGDEKTAYQQYSHALTTANDENIYYYEYSKDEILLHAYRLRAWCSNDPKSVLADCTAALKAYEQNYRGWNDEETIEEQITNIRQRPMQSAENNIVEQQYRIVMYVGLLMRQATYLALTGNHQQALKNYQLVLGILAIPQEHLIEQDVRKRGNHNPKCHMPQQSIHPDLFFHMAECCVTLKDIENAIKYYVRAMQTADTSETAWQMCKTRLAELAKDKANASHFKMALIENPPEPVNPHLPDTFYPLSAERMQQTNDFCRGLINELHRKNCPRLSAAAEKLPADIFKDHVMSIFADYENDVTCFVDNTAAAATASTAPQPKP